MSPETKYRIQKADQQEYGPFTQDQLRQLILDGQAFSRTLAKAESATGWRQLSEFPELAEALASANRNPKAGSVRLELPIAPTAFEPVSAEFCGVAGKSSRLGKLALGSFAAAFLCLCLVLWMNDSSVLSTALVGFVVLGNLQAFVLGLAAMVTAMVAGFRIRLSQGSLTGEGRGYVGFIYGLIPVLLLVVVVPNFVRQRTRPSQNACINNLRQMDGAKAQWALENKKVDSDKVTASDISPYLKNGVMPSCPTSGTYSVSTVAANPTCSIPGHTI